MFAVKNSDEPVRRFKQRQPRPSSAHRQVPARASFLPGVISSPTHSHLAFHLQSRTCPNRWTILPNSREVCGMCQQRPFGVMRYYGTGKDTRFIFQRSSPQAGGAVPPELRTSSQVAQPPCCYRPLVVPLVSHNLDRGRNEVPRYAGYRTNDITTLPPAPGYSRLEKSCRLSLRKVASNSPGPKWDLRLKFPSR